LQMSSSFGATSGSAGAGEGSRGVEKKGRKKVAKACLACQKSHVTCDDSESSLLSRYRYIRWIGADDRTPLYSMYEERDRTTMYRRSSKEGEIPSGRGWKMYVYVHKDELTR
jgi:hypothetical protein